MTPWLRLASIPSARWLLVLLAAAPLIACSGGSSPVAPTETAALLATSTPTPAEPTPTLEPGATPAPAPLRFRLLFDLDIPMADRTLIERGLEYAARYVEGSGGPPPLRTTVVVAPTPQAMTRLIVGTGLQLGVQPQVLVNRLTYTTAEAMPGAMVIAAGTEGWLQASDVGRFRVAAHEYFHVVQFELIGRSVYERMNTAPAGADRPDGPHWLFEGSAEYVAWKAMETAGLADLPAHLRSNPLASGADLRNLETLLEFAAGQPDGLTLPLAGVWLLLENTPADEPLEALLSYYRAVGEGTPWRTAFSNAFGRSVEAFYAEFDDFAGR